MRTTKEEKITFREPINIDVAAEARKRGVTKATLARNALLHFLANNQTAV
ncbi:hypothetical protein F7734_49100 [Scytonema sp. UIC 10036]|nr:hypothetical protein [Scytonema sp. UIC 10036]MUG99813.1 hypothetical protein [Scytonema sp. UIC 10036]